MKDKQNGKQTKDKQKSGKMPELLAPAGSKKALLAALDAGADAVYFGANAFNARTGADNFSFDELAWAIDICHTYGARAYLALNTLVFDKELSEYLKTASLAYELGADALIVADLGGAAAIRKYIPDIPLHASTQFSGHNSDAAKLLHSMGFSRMVLARETPASDIASFTKNSPIEAEVFVHGALCVSHSGQCLFSSVVGGRSGNRGECAQPCRLPYEKNSKYPLSLKDLCLASHITDLADMGVASLKIEGRMKSPEYVREVTSVYRRLLDEKRNACSDEISHLSSVFSRDGFTDGYFTSNISSKMLGTRSKSDKLLSRQLEIFDKMKRKIPIEIKAEILSDSPSQISVFCGEKSVSVKGFVPMKSINAPLQREDVIKSLSRLGDTPFSLEKIDVNLGKELMIPKSKLNELRRCAIEALMAEILPKKREKLSFSYLPPKKADSENKKKLSSSATAHFFSAFGVTEKATQYFDRIYLPLTEFCEKFANSSLYEKSKKEGNIEYGVAFPPVIFDSERKQVFDMAKKALDLGAKYALISNIGQIELAKETGLVLCGDFRLNICNSESSLVCEKLGLDSFILSPELSLPKMRDIIQKQSSAKCFSAVYGRIPLMLLEKCVISEVSSCQSCSFGKAKITDRKNISFPLLREGNHRNILFNSLPTFMADRQELLSRYGIENKHFIFTVENAVQTDKVILAHQKEQAAQSIGLSSVRRINE